MKTDGSFADVVRHIIGDRTQREVAADADISHTYLNHWLQGRRPQPGILRRFADNLALPADIRTRLLTKCLSRHIRKQMFRNWINGNWRGERGCTPGLRSG
jgi:transcriptional regulator with XRE-family HTH domain